MLTINKLLLFLAKHRTNSNGNPATHTGMYFPLQGSWNITNDSISEFWTLFNAAYEAHILQNKRLGIGLTEVQPEFAPLLIDLDFKYDTSKGDARLYTIDVDVNGVVDIYRKIVVSCVEEPELTAHVFEKPKPRFVNNQMKDGIHIMFTNIVLSKDVRQWIHDEAKSKIRGTSLFRSICENPSELIDTCAATNNWLIYGCLKRDDTNPYLLTHVFRHGDDRATVVKSHVEDPSVYSIRGKDPSKLLHDFTVASKPEPLTTLSNTHTTDRYTDEDKIRTLLSLLSSKRYESEPDWIRVGWCLHNISKKNLELWIVWSRQSEKFQEGECEKQWKRFRNDGYKIPSLCNWARTDNPEGYEVFIKENSKIFLEYSINCGAHYDIATVLYCKYNDVFRSVNPKKSDEWYYYDEHRWKEMPGGYILMNKMSVDLSKDFIDMANHHKRCMVHHDPAVVAEHKDKRNKCMKLEYSVKDNGFKTGVLKECARMFFDPEFSTKLDTKANLICFKNGMYEIDTSKFRDGQPDDYISKTTGIEYRSFSYQDEIVKEIEAFLTKVQPIEAMRVYVMKVLASFLGGSTEEQTFQIWTGSGSNGKSTIIELFERTFGDDYCGKFPVTLLTKDRANSNACTPELQDVMKKRFASMQEPNDNDVIHTGAMKEYTGGDKIYSRGLFSTPTPFKPQFKLVLLCNKMPHIKGWDYGTWRRIRVVNFMSSFVDNPNPENPHEYAKDKTLSDKFDGWKEAFMWMLLEYMRRYKREGMREPSQVVQSSKEYKKRSDSYLQFIDDNFVNTGNEQDKISFQEINEAFKMWWRNTNTTPVPSTNDLLDYIFANTKFKKVGKSQLSCIINKNVMQMSD
jgi:P4 family phage/plasmid primase-like protien